MPRSTLRHEPVATLVATRPTRVSVAHLSRPLSGGLDDDRFGVLLVAAAAAGASQNARSLEDRAPSSTAGSER